MFKRKLFLALVVLILIGGSVYYVMSSKTTTPTNTQNPVPQTQTNEPKAEVTTTAADSKEVEAYVLENNSISVDGSPELNSTLPDYVKYSNGQITLNPSKDQIGGVISVKFKNGVTYNVKITNRSPDLATLETKIKDYLGSKSNDFGVFMYDLKRNKSFNVNGSTKFGPASIIKMPYAILVLRDVDAGKVTLDSTYPIQNKLKFSYTDPLGVLAQGTQVKIRDYLSNMISQSSNTALLHLDGYLGGVEIVNQRIINELHANPFFYLPQETTANNVGNVFIELYNQRYLKKETYDYLIGLMKADVPDLKIGISNGLPDKSGVSFVNKVGFYDTDQDLAYQDSAIVWGEKTDYVLVVMDRNIDWASAQVKIKEISRLVYEELNK